jgi:CRISPR-associated protein Cas5 subtype I-B
MELPISCYQPGDPKEFEALTFDISFETAQFRKHLLKMYRDTYMIPLPSTVVGIIGAICGVKREFLKSFVSERRILTGATILGFEGLINEVATLIKMKDWREIIRTPVMSVILFRPNYRLAIASRDGSFIGELRDRLVHLDFEFDIYGGNDYNFVSCIGQPKDAKLSLSEEGEGICRLDDLKSIKGKGTLYLDDVNDGKVSRYAFSLGTSIKTKQPLPIVDDGERRIFVHDPSKFLR